VNLEPLTYEFMLRCSAEGAFATYTARIAEWWHPRYTANAETLQSVTIESRLGGRVYATHSDLGEHDWGKVTEWEPDRRFAHTFSLAQDLENPSNVRWPDWSSLSLGGSRAAVRRTPISPTA
jgi:hypothetical protein